MLEEGKGKDNNLQSLEQKKERIESEIFRKIWLSDPWSSEEQEIWTNVLHNPLSQNSVLCLIISALTLNLEVIFDEKKINLLFTACEDANEEVCQRALTGG